VDDVKKLLVNNLAEINKNDIFKTKSAKISFKQITKYRRKSFEPKILCREC
jgi:hypothetical protein